MVLTYGYQTIQTVSTSPRELPIFKLALALAFGVFLQVCFNLSSFLIGSFLFSSLVTFFILHQKRTLGYTHLARSGFIFLAFISLGALLFQMNEKAMRNSVLDANMFEDKDVLITCTSIPKHKRMTQLEAEITHLQVDSNSFKAIKPVKALIHIKDSSYQVRNGDVLRIKGIIKNTSKSNSPLVFDYTRYLKFKHIAYQTYLNPDQVFHISGGKAPWYAQARAWGIHKFEQHLSPINVAIASALVLGHRGLIDDNLYEAFAQTGSMHVLAVSGLHVGILSSLIGLFLLMMRSNEFRFKLLKSVILLCAIWSFAFITGGSPSVMRATLMFSILEVGKIWQGHYSVYNSIGAAALALLCIDPFMLFHVGFQLSFAAIISIVMFFSKVHNLLPIKNSVGKYMWQLMSVAISVQILTLPISLYYFHQFPLYFPITGITAVLLAMLILSCGLVMLFGSLFFSLAPLWKIYDVLVSLLAESTFYIHSLPYCHIPDVPFDQWNVLLSFIFVGSTSLFIFKKNKKALFIGLFIFLGLIIYHRFQDFQQIKKIDIVLYDARQPLVDIFVDGKVYTYADPFLTKKNISFATRNFRIHKRVKEVVKLQSEDHLRAFCDANQLLLKHIVEIDESAVYDRSAFDNGDLALEKY